MFLSLTFAILILLGEIMSLVYLYKFSLLNMELNKYIIIKIVVPSIINFVVLILGYFLVKMKKLPIVQKGIIPLCVITIISINFIIFHHQSPICILALILPILLSVLYSDSELTKKTALICCLISILTAAILFYFNHSLGYNYILNLFIALEFLIGLTITSFLMASLEVKKNELLITSVKQRDYYYDKSIIDGLTKSYNHNSYIETINANIDKYDDLILAIIDIDNFKSVNDTYGHSSGNIVLKSLAKILNKINSDEIYVSRYGGEEFVILFFNGSVDQAYKTIDKLRNKFSNIGFTELNNNNVTFSCGLAKKDKNSTPKSLFDKADEALYKAKNTGKNTIVISDF